MLVNLVSFIQNRRVLHEVNRGLTAPRQVCALSSSWILVTGGWESSFLLLGLRETARMARARRSLRLMSLCAGTMWRIALGHGDRDITARPVLF